MNDDIFKVLRDVVNICEREKIKYWIVGGFAVDAKRGYLSRNHGDIDICLHQQDMDHSLRCFFRNGFKITKEGLKFVFYKINVKIDVFELFVDGDYYLRKREWFKAKYPKKMFDNFQVLELNGLKFRIPSNEGIRYYGSKTVHSEDIKFTQTLPYDKEIYSKIEYLEFANYEESKKGVKIEELTFDK